MLLSLQDVRDAARLNVSPNGHAAAALDEAVLDPPATDREATGVPVRHLALGLTFGDIPDPEPCTLCGSPMQKEFLEYEARGGAVLFVFAGAPGYGCTGCEMKAFDPAVAVRALRRGARESRLLGDAEGAARLDREAAWVEESAAIRVEQTA